MWNPGLHPDQHPNPSLPDCWHDRYCFCWDNAMSAVHSSTELLPKFIWIR